MRLYVLVTSCDPLRVFIFRDGLVRFTTMRYAEPNENNISNVYMHLTNYAVQKHSDAFVRDNEEEGTKRRITTLNHWFKRKGFDLAKIWKCVDEVVVKTLLSSIAVLKHNYRTCFPNHNLTSACFEILGFDIMFDKKLKPYVLEVSYLSFHKVLYKCFAKAKRNLKKSQPYDQLLLE
ncbi:unnamed protein product [Protopolystoma xenopodis]|uniref:Tubulin--tyrosine ligase-like protein 9 n=1 Tax=Protopolystoma xenopodis TaxID=117903 RepID=A0A3S5BMD1_9PLAT|nr:unnamed protein product [Protopolystoma xenopodis]